MFRIDTTEPALNYMREAQDTLSRHKIRLETKECMLETIISCSILFASYMLETREHGRDTRTWNEAQ